MGSRYSFATLKFPVEKNSFGKKSFDYGICLLSSVAREKTLFSKSAIYFFKVTKIYAILYLNYKFPNKCRNLYLISITFPSVDVLSYIRLNFESFFCVFDGSTTECIRHLQFFYRTLLTEETRVSKCVNKCILTFG